MAPWRGYVIAAPRCPCAPRMSALRLLLWETRELLPSIGPVGAGLGRVCCLGARLRSPGCAPPVVPHQGRACKRAGTRLFAVTQWWTS
jgi:hypothetical protein